MNNNKQIALHNKAVSIIETQITTVQFETAETVNRIQLVIKAIELADKKEYLPMLHALAGNLLEQNNSSTSKDYSLYQGRMQTVFALIQVSKVTNETAYLDNALKIAKDCNTEFLHAPEITNGLFKGRAGTLLALLHLHEASTQEWILPYIKTYAEKIMQEAIITDNGAYWDHSAQHVKGLCDFAEGTAGISFVFRELASYFNNEAFNIVAHWATEYENAQWNTVHQNWGDYKKKITSKEEFLYYINTYKNDEHQAFSSNYSNHSWKQGSSGIVVSAQKSSNSQQLNNIFTIAEKLASEDLIYTTDAQFFGEIQTLFYAGNKLKNNDFKEKARSLLLDQMKNCQDQIALALLCFELSSDEIKSSVYCPILEKSNSEKAVLNLDSQHVKSLLLQRTFPKSLAYLANVAPTELETFLNEGKSSASFTTLLYSVYNKVATLEDVSSQMEILLEKAQFEMFTPNRNNVLLWIQKIVMQQRFSEAYADAEEIVLNKNLVLTTEDMKMVKVSNMKEIDLTNPNEHSLEGFINYGIDTFMLQMTDKGTIHQTSLQMIKLIYVNFITGNTIQNVITQLTQFLAGQGIQVIYGVRKALFIDDHINFEVGLKKALTRITIDMAYNGILKPVDGKLWA
ncbi:lanthionine synthetase LanC family protein [Kordia sp.]|uniref:lanthionine synthetase LanC family protein n=1 Tax=Kordia sp. TaxID=1965332 RepID=UPI003D2C19A3